MDFHTNYSEVLILIRAGCLHKPFIAHCKSK
jgi:hypothetical protein